MLSQIIRTIVMTAVREVTAQSVRKSFYQPKKKEERKSYYKGRK